MDENEQTGPTPPTAPRGRRRARSVVAAGVAAAVVLGGAAAGTGYLLTGHATATDTASAAVPSWSHGGAGRHTTSTAVDAATRSATTTEETGVVDIDTVLDYGTGEAAGTGIVLTSSGEILTNNHVVDGATAITVTVVATGTTYTASVVGTDATDDVAVLQLAGASGLTTAPLGTSADVAALAAGDTATAVGNAGGTGGTPTAATGTLVALDQTITAGDSTGANSEQLTGLLEVSADIQAGDSGGPLSVDGVVVGMDTAASNSSTTDTATTGAATTGYAIPITTATTIAAQIESGVSSGTIQQGDPAFLGVDLGQGAGVTISGVLAGSPAATAGLGAGDTITAVDGTTVDSTSALSTALQAHRPQDRVDVTWTDIDGASHTATVTLTAGPAV